MTTVDVLHPPPKTLPEGRTVTPGAVLRQALEAERSAASEPSEYDEVPASSEAKRKTVLVAGFEVPLGLPSDAEVASSAPDFDDDTDDEIDFEECTECKQRRASPDVYVLDETGSLNYVVFRGQVTFAEARKFCWRTLCKHCIESLVKREILARV